MLCYVIISIRCHNVQRMCYVQLYSRFKIIILSFKLIIRKKYQTQNKTKFSPTVELNHNINERQSLACTTDRTKLLVNSIFEKALKWPPSVYQDLSNAPWFHFSKSYCQIAIRIKGNLKCNNYLIECIGSPEQGHWHRASQTILTRIFYFRSITHARQ